jgi:hypothetical protein
MFLVNQPAHPNIHFPYAKHSTVFYLLNEFNASRQVHAKVYKNPIDSLFLVLFLFQHKHVMVEELLKFFVGEVDTQLLESVVLYLVNISETGNQWYTN